MSPLRIALPLALAVSLSAAAPAGALSPTLRTASLDNGLVRRASRAPPHRRLELLVGRPGATQRLRVFIERGDIWWGGKVVVQRLMDGRWVTFQRRDLDHAGQLRHTVCAEDLGVCVLGGSIKAPQPGAQRLAATFRLHGHGSWTLPARSARRASPASRPVAPRRRGALAF